MSTPRTPTKPASSSVTTESQKRMLSDSAELPEEKRQKDDGTPQWALKLFGEMGSLREEVSLKLTDLDAKVSRVDEKLSALEIMNERIDEMEGAVATNTDNIAKIRADIYELRENNNFLREKVEQLEIGKASNEKVAKLQDEQLRNSITVCGVAKATNEKNWKDTKNALVKALNLITPGEYNERYWFRAIQRAHRGKQQPGKIPVIHTKFVSWADKDYILNLFLGSDAPHNPSGIEFYDKFSEETQERRKLALARRKIIRGRDKVIKAYIRFPADLMVMRPGEVRYTCEQKF